MNDEMDSNMKLKIIQGFSKFLEVDRESFIIYDIDC